MKHLRNAADCILGAAPWLADERMLIREILPVVALGFLGAK